MSVTVQGVERREVLDFLRGVAILLVLLRHQYLFAVTVQAGWIGVDLFFVLSGFLVSGLLFDEYRRRGVVSPLRFLIRRGWKIYPLYYITCLLYMALWWQTGRPVEWWRLASELLLVQNYANGWGYLHAPTWSLAVEEHFYVGLALSVGWAVRWRPGWFGRALPWQRLLLWGMAFGLVLRLLHLWWMPEEVARRFGMTHLRADGLWIGVWLSYALYMDRVRFGAWYGQVRRWIWPAVVLLLAWTPWVEPTTSPFALTLGFGMTAAASGLVLLWAVAEPAASEQLAGLMGRGLVEGVSRIGRASYSIYLLHSAVNVVIPALLRPWVTNHYVLFGLCVSGSIVLGLWTTATVEAFFLRLRERCVPRQGKTLVG